MKILQDIEDNQFPLPPWLDQMGNYNHLPKPAVPCSMEEFWKTMRIHPIIFMDYRQVYLVEDNDKNRKSLHLHDARLFFFHNQAYAIVIGFDGDPQAYRLGCIHQWRELNEKECSTRNIHHEGRCYHVYECDLCGTIRSVDSSD